MRPLLIQCSKGMFDLMIWKTILLICYFYVISLFFCICSFVKVNAENQSHDKLSIRTFCNMGETDLRAHAFCSWHGQSNYIIIESHLFGIHVHWHCAKYVQSKFNKPFALLRNSTCLAMVRPTIQPVKSSGDL